MVPRPLKKKTKKKTPKFFSLVKKKETGNINGCLNN